MWRGAITERRQWKIFSAKVQKENIFRIKGNNLISQTHYYPYLVLCSDNNGHAQVIINGEKENNGLLKFDLSGFDVGRDGRFNCIGFALQGQYNLVLPTYLDETLPAGFSQTQIGNVTVLKWV